MKYMVEFSVTPGTRNKAVQDFEQQGPNRNLGVTFHRAWVGKNEDVIFALVESADESLVNSAAKSWTAIGRVRVTPVVDLEQF